MQVKIGVCSLVQKQSTEKSSQRILPLVSDCLVFVKVPIGIISDS